MLVIFVGGMVDENQAKRLGVPVTTGVYVAGVVEGMGAEAAGLQATAQFSGGQQPEHGYCRNVYFPQTAGGTQT